MPRPLLVLLLGADPTTRIFVESGFQTSSYEVAFAAEESEALHLVQTRRAGILVADMDADTSSRLAFVQAARKADPSLAVIYTASMPAKVPDRDKVKGAPCLRTPYHPHQLMSLIGQLIRRNTSEDEVDAA